MELCEVKKEIMKEDSQYVIERKLNKIYEKLLDMEQENREYRRYIKEQELRAEQKSVEERLLEMKIDEYTTYEKRSSKMDYFNDKF